MIASSWWKVGLGLLGVTGLFASSGAGCGSSTSSSSSDATSTSTSGTGGGGTGGAGTGGAGTGGEATTTSTTSTTTSTTSTTTSSTSSTSSSTSSTGTGMVKYETCSDCTDLTKGAPADECNGSHDACFANKNCVQLYNCVYDTTTGCNTDASGACCTFDCYEKLKTTLADPAAAQAAIDLYHAYDACLYCTTCTTQCDAQSYCAAYAAGPAGCVP